MTPLALSFQEDIEDLGEEGLRAWLAAAFHGPVPTYPAGWFHHDEDTALFGVFALVRSDIEAVVGDTVRAAASGALSDFPARDGSWIGLMEVYGIAHAFDAEGIVSRLQEILTQRLPVAAGHGGPDALLPETASEVLALREIFECGVRQFVRYTDSESRHTDFDDFARLCARLLGNAEWRPKLAPAYAPMAAITVMSAARQDPRSAERELETALAPLRSASRTDATPFRELYRFTAGRRTNGDDRYPYDFGTLERFLRDWVSEQVAMNAELLPHDAIAANAIFGPHDDDDREDPTSPSAEDVDDFREYQLIDVRPSLAASASGR